LQSPSQKGCEPLNPFNFAACRCFSRSTQQQLAVEQQEVHAAGAVKHSASNILAQQQPGKLRLGFSLCQPLHQHSDEDNPRLWMVHCMTADAREPDDLQGSVEPRDALFLPFASIQLSTELISKDLYKSVYKVNDRIVAGSSLNPSCTTAQHDKESQLVACQLVACWLAWHGVHSTSVCMCTLLRQQGSWDGTQVAIVKPCAADVGREALLLKDLGQHPNIKEFKR
jgi:hypothetical protein